MVMVSNVVASSPSPVAVGRGGHRPQRDTASLGEDRTFAPLLATVDWAWPGGLAAAGRLGDAPVHRQVLQFQTVHAVIGGQHRQA
jgi:hypothetical protein